jgi:hypothetical protein
VCVCVLTVSGDVELHQLHEVGHLRREPLDLIVTQTQFPQVQKSEERLKRQEHWVRTTQL